MEFGQAIMNGEPRYIYIQYLISDKSDVKNLTIPHDVSSRSDIHHEQNTLIRKSVARKQF